MYVTDSLLCEKGSHRRIRVCERSTPSVNDRGRACCAEATFAQVLSIVYQAISTFLPRSACRLENEHRVRNGRAADPTCFLGRVILDIDNPYGEETRSYEDRTRGRRLAQELLCRCAGPECGSPPWWSRTNTCPGGTEGADGPRRSAKPQGPPCSSTCAKAPRKTKRIGHARSHTYIRDAAPAKSGRHRTAPTYHPRSSRGHASDTTRPGRCAAVDREPARTSRDDERGCMPRQVILAPALGDDAHGLKTVLPLDRP